ncbi:hypothetical protein MASR1M65_18330 [Saprospiraceae bacterium]
MKTESKQMIAVTQTFLPPIEEYQAQVQRAYNNNWLTNRGELVRELEQELQKYLTVDNILITNNGTVPLQIALKLAGQGWRNHHYTFLLRSHYIIHRLGELYAGFRGHRPGIPDHR